MISCIFLQQLASKRPMQYAGHLWSEDASQNAATSKSFINMHNMHQPLENSQKFLNCRTESLRTTHELMRVSLAKRTTGKNTHARLQLRLQLFNDDLKTECNICRKTSNLNPLLLLVKRLMMLLRATFRIKVIQSANSKKLQAGEENHSLLTSFAAEVLKVPNTAWKELWRLHVPNCL